jgi:hypothetical protein
VTEISDEDDDENDEVPLVEPSLMHESTGVLDSSIEEIVSNAAKVYAVPATVAANESELQKYDDCVRLSLICYQYFNPIFSLDSFSSLDAEASKGHPTTYAQLSNLKGEARYSPHLLLNIL